MFILINLLWYISFAYALGKCTSECKEPTLIYESLNCEAILASPDDCCPSKYHCPSIEASKSHNEKCLFHGKFYSQGESIDDDEVFGSCRVGCSCGQLRSGQMGFTCAYLDCPRIRTENKPGCHIKYELDKCCSSDVVCPPFSATCEVDGKVYHEGQMFPVPHNKCKKCVCQEGFEGKFEAPFCKKRDCLDEVGYQTKIRNFCAPSYITKEDCCPFSWICPETTDTIIPAEDSTDQNLTCRFGEKTIAIGDSFERIANGGKVSCECRIPPFLTCIQDYQFPRNSEDY